MMKRVLLFTLPILIVIAGVFAVFGFFQVRFQQERLYDDLNRKAKNVAESMELSARDVFVKNDIKTAQRLVDKFQKRERLQGCIFYNKESKVLAITERISESIEKNDQSVAKAISNAEAGYVIDKSFYGYILPITDDNNKVLGAIKVVYDTTYINNTLTVSWKRISITLFWLMVLIIAIIVILQRQIFFLPLKRLTEWFQHFQKGDIDDQLKIKDIGDFGKLASEVEQVALGLRVARKSLSAEALQNLNKAELWDEAKLKNLVHAKLGENSLFVVSNREPYMHVLDDDTGLAKCVKPASGVVTALDPILKACGGMWIAQGSGQEDRKFVNSKDKLGVPTDDIHYILKRIWLSKEEENGYYLGFSNEGLWPLCHITFTRPTFRQSDWETYKKVNQKFADKILEELPAKNPFIFIQDYHFTLLPKMIKEKRPDAIVAMFWHIPWPNPEVFSICPYQEEILDGMLGCDLIGFHVQYHCNNFIDTCNRLLESRIDTEKFSIVRSNKETLIRAFPISIDLNSYAISKETEDAIKEIKKEYDLEDKIIGVGVERIDYTKGLVERMLAIEKLLEKHPEYKNKFVYIQLAAPSRTHIKKYHDLIGEIDEVAERINWKYSENGWKPIIYLKRHFSSDEIKPYYAMADFCMVSSLHDGMNLVAKEYIASKPDYKGVLILSCFTGAARELVEAIQINPYSIDKFADAIRFAIEMPEDEKIRRMKNMFKNVSENNIFRWAGLIINDLTALRKV